MVQAAKGQTARHAKLWGRTVAGTIAITAVYTIIE